jgi:glutamate-1-semialdehyde 2,1-aminomutase
MLRENLEKSIKDNDLEGYIGIFGRECCLVFGTADNDKKPSQGFRTLLLQELIKHGVLAPSLIVSYSHTDMDIEKTCTAFNEAFKVYRKALTDGLEHYLKGRPVKPVFRKFG